MFKSILCPNDGSGHAEKALDLAVDMAKRYDAKLMLVHVLLRQVDGEELKRFAEIEGLAKTVAPEAQRLMGVDSRMEVGRLREVAPISSGMLVDIGEHLLKAGQFKAKAVGVTNVSTAILDGDPAKRILEHAESEGADCIVMGSRGLSDVKALLLGSVSRNVTNRAKCTVIQVN